MEADCATPFSIFMSTLCVHYFSIKWTVPLIKKEEDCTEFCTFPIFIHLSQTKTFFKMFFFTLRSDFNFTSTFDGLRNSEAWPFWKMVPFQGVQMRWLTVTRQKSDLRPCKKLQTHLPQSCFKYGSNYSACDSRKYLEKTMQSASLTIYFFPFAVW